MSTKDEYLQRAKEADERAANAKDARVKEDWRKIADGYRDLARRQTN